VRQAAELRLVTKIFATFSSSISRHDCARRWQPQPQHLLTMRAPFFGMSKRL
jgi:hypothetical protein